MLGVGSGLTRVNHSQRPQASWQLTELRAIRRLNRKEQGQMHKRTIRITDGVYEAIVREAARRRVSLNEVIDDWLLEGEGSSPPWESRKHD